MEFGGRRHLAPGGRGRDRAVYINMSLTDESGPLQTKQISKMEELRNAPRNISNKIILGLAKYCIQIKLIIAKNVILKTRRLKKMCCSCRYAIRLQLGRVT